ncbi:MAG: TfoX/Sxy family protein [Planctomycetales bacterium]|nr:TfoX/Sxy family protein [Planctomycetales bacterium]
MTKRPSTIGERIADMRNLGPRSEEMLGRAGIHSPAEIRRLGAVLVYRRVAERESRASLNLLWALEGALRDIDWRDLTQSDKARLLQEIRDV